VSPAPPSPDRRSLDWAEPALQAAAFLLTCALVAAVAANPPTRPAPLMEAPKPTEVALSVVEEPPPPPPPPQAAPPPEPEPPPPPPKVEPSPLPPPPPKPRHIVRPKRPPPPQPVEQTNTPPPTVQRPRTENAARVAQQAPENHSAVAAYIGRLHALVARNTVPPTGAAYRMMHPSGEVLVGFTLTRGGAVSDVHILRSSGSALLDTQALSIVGNLRYPGIPDDVYPGSDRHEFSVPVAFPYNGPVEGL
jgi:protein TonB